VGAFSGVSVAWRLSQEDFVKNLGFLNDLKIRASYGRTGNQEGIGLYDYSPVDQYRGKWVLSFWSRLPNPNRIVGRNGSTSRTWETLITKISA